MLRDELEQKVMTNLRLDIYAPFPLSRLLKA